MPDKSSGVTRRDALRRGGGVVLATVWVAPVIQSIGGTASAGTTGSPAPTGVLPTKQGSGAGGSDTGVLGSRLPGTGNDSPLLEVAVVGAGMVAAGAAVRKIVKRGPDSDGAGDEAGGEAPA